MISSSVGMVQTHQPQTQPSSMQKNTQICGSIDTPNIWPIPKFIYSI